MQENLNIILKIDNFEGPLDLLLHLIESKKLKISEIKISQIIDEYLSVIDTAKADNLDIKVEFLVIASELLEIKALSLLKMNEEENKEKELKRRLEDYKIFKEISVEIAALENVYNISYSRGESRKIIKKVPKEYDLSNISAQDLYRSYKNYLDNFKEDTIHLELTKNYSLKEESENLYLKIYKQEKSFDELFSEAENRMHLIYIFLSILELYKEGKIDIEDKKVKKI